MLPGFGDDAHEPDPECPGQHRQKEGRRIVQRWHFRPEQHATDAGQARLTEHHGQHIDRVGTETTVAVHQRVGQGHKHCQPGQTEIGPEQKLRTLLLFGRLSLRDQKKATGKRHPFVLNAQQVSDLAPGLGAQPEKRHASALGPGALRQGVAGTLGDQRARVVAVVERGFVHPGQVHLQQPTVLAPVHARHKADPERVATAQQQRVAFRPACER